MRLPTEAHTRRPWRIHEIAHDFRLEDVWALPTPGDARDFRRLVDAVAAADPAESSSWIVRTLFAVRWKLGGVLGWDSDKSGAGSGRRVPSLRERVPDDLRSDALPSFSGAPFTPLYLADDEFAAEIANQTMHGVLHLGWVPDASAEGRYRGQMAVLVKPNGLMGEAYMAAIKPFRYLFVYPTILRDAEQRWKAGGPGAADQPRTSAAPG